MTNSNLTQVAETVNGTIDFNYETQEYLVNENGQTWPATEADKKAATWYSEDERQAALA